MQCTSNLVGANWLTVSNDTLIEGSNSYPVTAFSVGETGGSPYTTPVGYFAANNYGLFDMAGNVNEWCWDWYGTPYGQPTPINPTGPPTSSTRAFRAGDCDFSTSYQVRVADRNSGGRPPDYVTQSDVGFRCVRRL